MNIFARQHDFLARMNKREGQVVRQALSIRYELKRACGLEREAESVVRSGRLIRNPQVHVPPSLTATCQLQELSLKAERNTYIWPKAATQFFRFCFV